MAGTFNRDEVSMLLNACHRRCCICHRFCGVKMETDHIVPGGSNDIDNAIPVCFECHAEIHCYNDQHPRGRKYLPDELKGHKTQWIEICSRHPEIFAASHRQDDVGPLTALIDELEYNMAAGQYSSHAERGSLFKDAQFHRALEAGAISILDPTIKTMILDAYARISRANNWIQAEALQEHRQSIQGQVSNNASKFLAEAVPTIKGAHDKLMEFLKSEQ